MNCGGYKLYLSYRTSVSAKAVASAGKGCWMLGPVEQRGIGGAEDVVVDSTRWWSELREQQSAAQRSEAKAGKTLAREKRKMYRKSGGGLSLWASRGGE